MVLSSGLRDNIKEYDGKPTKATRKPTNCGTKAADVPEKFFTRHILGAQHGKELGFSWRMESSSKQSKVQTRLPSTTQYEAFTPIFRRFAGIPMLNYDAPFP